MAQYQEGFFCHKDVFSRFHVSISATTNSEALRKQICFNKREEQESDPTWNNLGVSAKHRHIDHNKMEMGKLFTHHLGDISDFNFLKMHLLNHFSDHIWQLGNLGNASAELPERTMMDLNHVYWQWHHHEVAWWILRTNAQQEVFRCREQNKYRELNDNDSTSCRGIEMPVTKAPL